MLGRFMIKAALSLTRAGNPFQRIIVQAGAKINRFCRSDDRR